MSILRGKAHRYGDNVDTDVIIPARYCTSIRVEDLAPHCLEDLDTHFVKKVRKGDFIVAGRNFGCGSSREVAPIAIRGAGVSCVIAAGFARIFYRNAINIGLPILESPEAYDGIKDGDEIEADLATGVIRDLTLGREFRAASFEGVMLEIINLGGMEAYVRKRLAEKKSKEASRG
ncbi:MAG: 3-isopropylmalate dehydratase small subunit [Myxococcota bacterium]